PLLNRVFSRIQGGVQQCVLDGLEVLRYRAAEPFPYLQGPLHRNFEVADERCEELPDILLHISTDDLHGMEGRWGQFPGDWPVDNRTDPARITLVAAQRRAKHCARLPGNPWLLNRGSGQEHEGYFGYLNLVDNPLEPVCPRSDSGILLLGRGITDLYLLAEKVIERLAQRVGEGLILRCVAD